MATAPTFSSFPSEAPIRNAKPGDVVQLIFAGHKVAKLLIGDGRCVCGVLSGDAFEPASHNNPTCCPVAVFYQAVKDCEVK